MTQTAADSKSVYDQLFEDKYCAPGTTRAQALRKIAGTLSGDAKQERDFNHILDTEAFLPAGRVLAAFGAERQTTPYNCFVSQTIPDSMEGIMESCSRAAQILRRGGGIGYDFSTIRPRGTPIKSFDTSASGPLSFMHVFEAMARTVTSAGERRGAQMAVLRVDHPDIEDFVSAKCVPDAENPFRMFNFSVGVTDEFMRAVAKDLEFGLRWQGRTRKLIRARELWAQIMENTWEWSDPGVLFIERINALNNLYYCEEIAATNPCGEQPLPPNGACLLGSVNLTQFLTPDGKVFNWPQLAWTVRTAVRMLDAVIDQALYPLEEHRDEMLSKRRMGVGVMGLANAGETFTGHPYGSPEFCEWVDMVFRIIRDSAYAESIILAYEKGSFPLFKADKYLAGSYIKSLPRNLRDDIGTFGIRNSHLISVAPTGTLSLVAGNVSSGIEPVFSESQDRSILMKGDREARRVQLRDYGVERWGTKPWTSGELFPAEHLGVVRVAQKYVDSGISKTCNIHDKVSRPDFEEVYKLAWEYGLKGCTTFRPAGRRGSILRKVEQPATACYITPDGQRMCE